MEDLLFDIGETIGKAEIIEVQDDQPNKKRVQDMWTPLPFAPLTGAAFSPCRQYRWSLWRRWKENAKTCLFCMLNPSTADEIKNDPTVERCERYAKSWGYGRLIVVNMFAFRATDPKKLKWTEDPVGVHNDAWIKKMAEQSQLLVMAWGNHGKLYDRDKAVANLAISLNRDLHCLKLTKCGQPVHPLYQKKDLQPIPLWRPNNV